MPPPAITVNPFALAIGHLIGDYIAKFDEFPRSVIVSREGWDALRSDEREHFHTEWDGKNWWYCANRIHINDARPGIWAAVRA